MGYLLSLLLLINLIVFIVYGVDKYRAVKGKYRVSEKKLLWLAFWGGAVGALLSMIVFNHKIRKRKFIICVPLFLLIQIVLFVVFIKIG